VQDFDDRLKKAQGKERIIERVVSGPVKDGSKGSQPPPSI
jgi:ribosomal protein S28E/S33